VGLKVSKREQGFDEASCVRTHKGAQAWQTTVTRTQHGVIERLPSGIRVELWHAVCPLSLAHEAEHGVEVPIVSVSDGALLAQLCMSGTGCT